MAPLGLAWAGCGSSGGGTGGAGATAGSAGAAGSAGVAGTGGSAGSAGSGGSSATGGSGGGCPVGQEQCGGSCANLQTDPLNCGTCANVCPAGLLCAAGQCTLTCQAGLTECDGACVNTDTDNANCGGCGTACGAGELCSAGSCAVSCQTGLTECNGTCVNTVTDNANCGSCGTACSAGQVCSGSQCGVSCQTGLVECAGTCVNTQTDNANCGSCGTVCSAGQACSAGQCALSCQAGLTNCNGTCANTQTDNANCGSCGTQCTAGQVCSGGQCSFSCQPGQTLCGSTCTNLQNDPQNCGGCNVSCAAGQACLSGVCKGTVCVAGSTEICYTGALSTLGVGPCKSGIKTCNSQGTGYGACTGEVTPVPEICGDAIDQNCDGVVVPGSTPVFSEDFADNSAGWTLDTEWQIGSATASTCGGGSTGNDPASDHSASADNGVAGVVIGGCYSTTLHPAYCITSPVIDIASLPTAYLTFWRHLHTDYPSFVTSTVQVTSNGSTWSTVYTVPSSTFINDSTWTKQQYDVSAHKSATFQVRFCHATGSSGIITGGGWSIDDVEVGAEPCQ